MTKSHERFPIGSPLMPMRVMISRVASNSIVLPLWRRLETTGYFTLPPYQLTLASIAQRFILSRKSGELSGASRAREEMREICDAGQHWSDLNVPAPPTRLMGRVGGTKARTMSSG